jgi:hypothetical protein
LADQKAGQGRAGVHAVVGQDSDRLELFVAEQVGFVDDDDRGAAAFVVFGGDGGCGLGYQSGGVLGGFPAECGDGGSSWSGRGSG